MSNSLSLTQRTEHLKRITRLHLWKEDTIQAGIDLAYIRDNKTYRDDFDTFEEFCEAEFGMSRPNAYRLIEFSQIKLSPMGDKIENERQAREISNVPEKNREDVLKEASKGGLTAKKIKDASNLIKADLVAFDKTEAKYPIPKEILSDWDNAELTARELLNQISEIKVTLESARETGELIFREVSQSAATHAINLYTAIKNVVPYSVCTSCQGRNRSKCTTCRGRGFFSKDFYEIAIPKEIKDLRNLASK